MNKQTIAGKMSNYENNLVKNGSTIKKIRTDSNGHKTYFVHNKNVEARYKEEDAKKARTKATEALHEKVRKITDKNF